MTPTPTPLEQLALKCETATTSSRELDVEIAQAVWPQLDRYAPHCKGEEPIFWEDPFRKRQCPEFTKSLDAAMTLIPANCRTELFGSGSAWSAYIFHFTRESVQASSRPGGVVCAALALTAASLRARAALAKEPTR